MGIDKRITPGIAWFLAMVHSAFLFLISSRIVFFLPQIAYPLVFVCCFEEVLRVTAERLLLLSSLFFSLRRNESTMEPNAKLSSNRSI